MRKYKGYYIDGVIFQTERDIDNFTKKAIIDKIRMFHEMLFGANSHRYNPYDLCKEIDCREVRLHDEYKMSWEDIEEIPFMSKEEVEALCSD